MKSGNPIFSLLDRADSTAGTQSMTVNGTLYKTIFLLMLVTAGMVWSWGQHLGGGVMIGLVIGALAAGLVTSFIPSIAWIGAPVYAILEGLLLGVISSMLDAHYHGIAIQAVGLTFGVLFAMAGLYVTRIIRVTEQLRACILAATVGVGIFYFIGWIASFFGVQIPGIGMGGGWVAIGINLVVVGIASFNLLIDFDSIEQGARSGVPQSYEWFCAFGLLVTLVWLYIELLKLLARLRDNR